MIISGILALAITILFIKVVNLQEEVKNLKTQFFTQDGVVHAVNGISYSVGAGETVAIVGRSGEGKSTLLHILGTLDSATDGLLTIASQVVTPANVNAIRLRHLGLFFNPSTFWKTIPSFKM